MDALQKHLKQREELEPSSSARIKLSLFRALKNRLYFASRLLSFETLFIDADPVEKVSQADMIVDEQTTIFYKALQLAGKEPRFYDPIVDAFKGRDSTDYALTSLTLAESLAEKFSYDRALNGLDTAAKNVVKRLSRSVNHDAEIGRYSNPNWSGKATERSDRVRDLVGRYGLDTDVATAYRKVIEGLTAEVRHEAQIGRYSHSDWTVRAIERADRVRLLNDMYGLGIAEGLAYGMIIDGLAAEVDHETTIGKYSHPDWQFIASGKAYSAMGLAVAYAPNKISGLQKSFTELGLTLAQAS